MASGTMVCVWSKKLQQLDRYLRYRLWQWARGRIGSRGHWNESVFKILMEKSGLEYFYQSGKCVIPWKPQEEGCRRAGWGKTSCPVRGGRGWKPGLKSQAPFPDPTGGCWVTGSPTAMVCIKERTTRTGLLLSGLWCADEQGWKWWSQYLLPFLVWRICQSSHQPFNVSPAFKTE